MKSIYSRSGVLNQKEISAFKLELIRSKLHENKNRFLKWIGAKNYPAVAIENITIPDSKLASLAIEEANDLYNPSLLKHCYRTYYFSAGLAFSECLKIDKEFLFTTAILHDIGLTDKHNHICSQQCFATYGGNLVKQFALKNGTDKSRAHHMQAAIDMHLNPHVNKTTFGNEAYTLSKGAAMDVIGAHSFQLSSNFMDSIHHKFPRSNFKKDILHTMTSLQHKEHTRADILFKMGFQKMASANKLDHLYDV